MKRKLNGEFREDEKSREVESRLDNSRWRQDDRKMDDRQREADRRAGWDREEQSRREEAAEENKPVLKNHNKRRYERCRDRTEIFL